jgi:hypothetical protein
LDIDERVCSDLNLGRGGVGELIRQHIYADPLGDNAIGPATEKDRIILDLS